MRKNFTRNTNPYPTWLRNGPAPTGPVRHSENLGSDYYIIHSREQFSKLACWSSYGKDAETVPLILCDLNALTEALQKKVLLYTHEVTLTDDHLAVDGHMQHIWEGLRHAPKPGKIITTLKLSGSGLTTSLSKQRNISPPSIGRPDSRYAPKLLPGYPNVPEICSATYLTAPPLAPTVITQHSHLSDRFAPCIQAILFSMLPTYPSPRSLIYTGRANLAFYAPFTTEELLIIIASLKRNATPRKDSL